MVRALLISRSKTICTGVFKRMPPPQRHPPGRLGKSSRPRFFLISPVHTDSWERMVWCGNAHRRFVRVGSWKGEKKRRWEPCLHCRPACRPHLRARPAAAGPEREGGGRSRRGGHGVDGLVAGGDESAGAGVCRSGEGAGEDGDGRQCWRRRGADRGTKVGGWEGGEAPHRRLASTLSATMPAMAPTAPLLRR
jgi:hypothetical protein